MKKVVACLLSVCLCIQGTIGARAANAADGQPVQLIEGTAPDPEVGASGNTPENSVEVVLSSETSEEPDKVILPGDRSEELDNTILPGDGSEELDNTVLSGDGSEEPDKAVLPGDGSEELGKAVLPGNALEEASQAEASGSTLEEASQTNVSGHASEEASGADAPDEEVKEPVRKGSPSEAAAKPVKGSVREPVNVRKGAVRVELRTVIPVESSNSLEIFLESADLGVIKADTISIEGLGKSSIWHAEEIPMGKYTLTIKGQSYETYKQELNVDHSLSDIRLMNGYLDGYTYSSDKKHPGVLRTGDMNGDGKLDEADLEVMLDALEDGSDSGCDLNGDGVVDLLDLQYFSQFYNDKRDNQASIVRNAVINNVVASSSNAQRVDGGGSLEDLFSNHPVPVTVQSENDQAISESNPVEVSAEIDTETKVEAISIVSPPGSENTIDKGEATVVYTDADGVEKSKVFSIGPSFHVMSLFSRVSAAKAERNGDGTIVLFLGGQVAVKRVSIKVTATTGSGGKLVDISKVEFLNDMKDRIPEPNMNIPTNLQADERSEEFTLTWKKQANVSGYEVKIWKGEKGMEDSAKPEFLYPEKNEIKVTSYKNDKLVNGDAYTVRVRSVNGDWKGGFSEPLRVTPRAMKRPDAPEGVNIAGKYRSLEVSWKKMKDTDSYTIFYRPYNDSMAEYRSIGSIEANHVVIENLTDETEYTVYLIGHNALGDSDSSKSYRGKTTSLAPPVTPNYKLINVPSADSSVTAHIEHVSYVRDQPRQEFAVVDNDYSTSWVVNDWDAGVDYPAGNKGKAPIVEFDDVYELDTIVLVPDENQKFQYNKASCYYWEASDGQPVKVNGVFTAKTSSNGKRYYEFQTNKPVEAKKIQLNLSNAYGAANRISIAELKYYYYDSLEYDINELFADDMHVTLKTEVTEGQIEALNERLQLKDPVWDEFHPKKGALERELDTAYKILTDGQLSPVVTVDTSVTRQADGNITFLGGLNSWQPLGVTGLAGEEVTVYVGSPGKSTGDSTNVRLVFTQYHGEASSWFQAGSNLKAGPNKITIPQLTKEDVEQGGQLYIEYTGGKSAERYSVRVSGGNKIPVLDLTKASDSQGRRLLTKKYVEELEAYVPEIENVHRQVHGQTAFDKKTCVLGATDIVTRFAMLSVPSDRILASLSGSTDQKAEQLYQSLTAMDQMVTLFYQHKGLSERPLRSSDRLPVSRLNIRYQRMFAGAFMYAGGLHIGIEWDSVPGLGRGVPVEADAEGGYVNGRYFGWGISHEIGHIINEKAYEIAEITNNYFSLLGEARDTNASVRFSYKDVYNKVTSGVKGRSSNVFTQLGLYWQLHLAYDRGGLNFKTFDKPKDQLDNLIFARMDSYARDRSLAPHPGGIALTLDERDVDNKLMRLACGAAEKNILEFFERWGMMPDAVTRKYASQFDKEKRAIWFVNDDARVYAMENPDGSIASETRVNAVQSYVNNTNEVTLTIGGNGPNEAAMLGYEIYRSEFVKNKVIRKPVGFITADMATYTDTISAINNRVFQYDVVGYDKYLNATERFELAPVKVSHGGYMDRTEWSAATNMLSDEDGTTQTLYPEKAAVPNFVIGRVIDGDEHSTYTGRSKNSITAPEIIINLNRVEAVTGIVYTLEDEGTPITDFEIYVSQDGMTWTKVQQSRFAVKAGKLENGSQTIYFNKPNDPWLYTYDASYVKLVATKQKGVDITVGELNVLGESGDDVEFETDGIGRLKNDYVAGNGESGSEIRIPKGSVIFTGAYKGNPAYNTVLLYDENNQIVGGTNPEGDILANQLIFAKVPEHGELGEISAGTWIYYIEPEAAGSDFKLPGKVRAELYRVDDAETNRGERLVSDTLYETVPAVLPEIEITASSAYMKGQ